ncbi:unnamed protein product, partial [marine sediment metagenome]
MKHKLVMVMLSVALIVSLALVGCVPEAAPEEEEEEEAPVEEVEILKWKIPTGSPTGTYFIGSTAVCRALSNNVDYIHATATPGGGGVSNCRKVNAGEAPFAFCNSAEGYQAYSGLAPFEKIHGNLRSWGTMHALYISWIVKADSPIIALADLEGEKVATGEPGSGDAGSSETILTVAGLYDKIIRIDVGDPESWDLLKLGKADAVIHHTTPPNASLLAFSATCPIRLLEIPDALANDLIAELPYFGQATVAADTYEGQAEDVRVLIIPVMLIINKDIADDVVYDMCTALWANFDDVALTAPFLEGKDLTQILSGISVPLHPGAVRYYEEKGFTIPEAI